MVLKVKTNKQYVEAVSGLFKLTVSDKQLIELLMEGITDRKVLAEKLEIDYRSIGNYFKRLRNKRVLTTTNELHKIFLIRGLLIEKAYETKTQVKKG